MCLVQLYVLACWFWYHGWLLQVYMHAIVSSMHLFWTQLYLYYASAMYKQKYFDIVNYVLLYSSYLANKIHTEKIHAQYNLFHLKFCCCPLCSCMVDCCIWLFFCIFCIYIIPAFFVERSLLLGYNSFDIALTYPYDTTLVITHCCLISKEIYNTILCILLYNSYTHIQYNVNDTNPHQTQLNFQRNSFQ